MVAIKVGVSSASNFSIKFQYAWEGTMMIIRDAAREDLEAITAIFNSTIAGRMVTANSSEVSVESRIPWFEAHLPGKMPLWVAEEKEIAGWLGFQPFNSRPAYHATVEISLYIAKSYRRSGVGTRMFEYAVSQCPQLHIKTLVGLIFAHNEPSISLVEKLGFKRWGLLPGVAELDEVERDLAIYGFRV
jgi:phosphinothricin acetyltransferase